MKREDVLKEMKEMVGNKDPIEFFAKMVDMFGLLFDRIDQLESNIEFVKITSVLAIQWEPKIASDMLALQINTLRQDKETYFNELSLFKIAFAENKVTQEYQSFCQFWTDTLGYHPFLTYSK